MIKLLEDNTVLTEFENVNSVHSHKALTPQTKAIADAFPYLFETEAGEGEDELLFNGRQVFGGDPGSGRYKLFASLVMTDELIAALKAEADQAEIDKLASVKAEEDRFDAAVAKAVAKLAQE